jgi:hypothetical protein
MWAEAYLEEVMDNLDKEITDSWNMFIVRLDANFTDLNTERAAQSELEMLREDKHTLEDFFFHFEQIAHRAGY